MPDVVETITPTASLADALGKALTASRDKASTDHFRMSSFGQCPAAQIGLRAGVPVLNPWDRRVKFKLWVGSTIHTALQGELTTAGFLAPDWTEREVRYRSYVGHVDGLTHALPCGDAVVEIKTADDSAIAKADWPEHYLWQGLLYAVAAGVPNLLLFQLGKNQGLSRERVVPVTDEWRTRIETSITWVEQLWEEFCHTRKLPHHGHQFSWEDRTCPYLTEEDKQMFHEVNQKGRR